VVLLHVVAAAVRVHHPVDAVGRERAIEHVEDGARPLDHGEDARLAQRARVPGLAAALGVERRAVEDDHGAALVVAAGDDRRIELEGVGVVQVDPQGHGTFRRARSGA